MSVGNSDVGGEGPFGTDIVVVGGGGAMVTTFGAQMIDCICIDG